MSTIYLYCASVALGFGGEVIVELEWLTLLVKSSQIDLTSVAYGDRVSLMNNNTIPAKKVASGLVSEKALDLADKAMTTLNELYWTDELSKSQRKAIAKAVKALEEFGATDELDEPW